MLNFFLTWLLSAISLWITAFIVPGLTIASWQAAAIGVVIMGLVNAIVKPILILFTLPLTLLTLGFFLLVVNAISLGLVGYFTPGFTVAGFFPALFGSIVLSLVSSLIGKVFDRNSQEI
ncbi:MAG: phage holin family protein [Limnoraphis sp.]